MPWRSACIALVLVAFPFFAHAKQETVWDFADNAMPIALEAKGLQAQPTEYGLLLRAQGEGVIFADIHLEHDIDMVHITYVSNKDHNANFLFTPTDETNTYKYPFVLHQTDDRETLYLNIASYYEWDPSLRKVGFMVEPGTEIILETVTFTALSPLDHAKELFASFWKYDNLTGHNINFLWGPQLTWTTAGTMLLHEDSNTPPIATSATAVLTAILLVLLAMLFALYTFGRLQKTSFVHYGILLIAAFWIFYDLRIGAELIDYAVADYRTYHSQSGIERTFRDMDEFQGFAQSVAEHVRNEKEYVYFATPGYEKAFGNLMRYTTYPALPVLPDQATKDTRYWVIQGIPNIQITESGSLLYENEVISPTLSIAELYMPGFSILQTVQ